MTTDEAPMTPEELMRLLWAAARKGSVTAMRLLLQEQRRQEKESTPGPPGSGFIDELLARRKPKT